MLGRANRTRELRFFTAFFSLVPRQRWFPYVLLPARVAAVLSTITLVVIGPLISWKIKEFHQIRVHRTLYLLSSSIHPPPIRPEKKQKTARRQNQQDASPRLVLFYRLHLLSKLLGALQSHWRNSSSVIPRPMYRGINQTLFDPSFTEWKIHDITRVAWISFPVFRLDVLSVRDDPFMNVYQMFLQHPLVAYFNTANWTGMLRCLAALFALVSHQWLHPSVLLAARGAKVSSHSFVIVRRVEAWKRRK